MLIAPKQVKRDLSDFLNQAISKAWYWNQKHVLKPFDRDWICFKNRAFNHSEQQKMKLIADLLKCEQKAKTTLEDDRPTSQRMDGDRV